jgi:DNA-binding MarR family transcriptional regulator
MWYGEHVRMASEDRRDKCSRSAKDTFCLEATSFLFEIINAADCLRDAKTFTADPALCLEPRWRLLRAIERCGGAPTLSDLGRLLKISRQGAREQALPLVQDGLLELFRPPDDRRVWQVMLTPKGRRALERQRTPDTVWMFTLLNGLDPRTMRATQHVLRVIRLRLEGYARDLSAASARR